MTAPSPRLAAVEYVSLSTIAGPLIFVEGARGVGYGEVVDVIGPSGTTQRGQVIEVHEARAVVQVFGETRGLDIGSTRVRFTGDVLRIPVGADLLGRTLDPSGTPLDGMPPPVPDELADVNGLPINPAVRENPSAFVHTGISAIDGLNTLVRGQKLPVFSAFGLPGPALAARIATGAATGDTVVVLAAIGITRREAAFFRRSLDAGGALGRTVLFVNLADDPVIERLLAPRAALATAEHLAFELGMHVLVLLTDMTNYCEALREVGTARDEIPGRRGYPAYMYTDLASIYERAGRIRNRSGSVTQIVVLSMPGDDMTHPIPDLTGYITEGQIVLSRELYRRGIDPPIDVLPSLSRLMNAGVGAGRTRDDHRALADQLYALYARGRDLRRLVAIVGEAALGPGERRRLGFADEIERRFVHHAAPRTIDETLEEGWRLLDGFADDELVRIPREVLSGRAAARAQATAT